MKKKFILALLVLFTLLLAVSAAWFFYVIPRLSGQPYTRALALADLDGDGDLDAVPASGRNEGLFPGYIWLNDGSGGFTRHTEVLPEADRYHVALADLDSDGDLDAVYGTSPNVRVFFNDGTGGFPGSGHAFGDFVEGVYAWHIALGDLDADGDLDLFLAGCCGAVETFDSGTRLPYAPTNLVWLNDGSGAFADSGQRLGEFGSQAVALGDLDRDGDLDAFIGTSLGLDPATGADDLHQPDLLWLNDGAGNFTDSGLRLGASLAQSVALADLDRDGDLDALVGTSDGVERWLNDGRGAFALLPGLLESQQLRLLSLSDLDGDADLDLAVGEKDTLRFWLNDGAANFTQLLQSLPLKSAEAFSLGDLDSDGDADVLVVGMEETRSWLNTGSAVFSELP